MCNNMNLQLSMFQCMASVCEHTSFDLCVLYKHWLNKESMQNCTIVPYAPGSLGQVTNDTDVYQVGSLQVKTFHADTNTNYSLLIFKNNRIKVSGGLAKMKPDQFSFEYLHSVVDSLLRQLDIMISDDDTCTIHSYMVNGNAKRNIPIRQYEEFVYTCMRTYSNVTPPTSWDVSKKQRGRICATKVKLEKGTIITDHSGNVQLFGFRDIQYMCKQLAQFLDVMSMYL